MLTAWLGAFLFTQAVEAPILAWALGDRRRWPARVALALGASALTHPVVWFVIPRLLAGHDYVRMVVVAELFAVAVETVYLRALGARRPLLGALAANGASLTLGLTSRRLFGWP